MKVYVMLGGLLRLLGSGGGTRDIVETGVNGLKFGGDTELSSPIPGHVGYFAGPNIAAELVAGGVELTQPTPYIDFKDTLADDFDARLWMPTPGTMEFNAPGGVRANGAPISKGWVFVPIATQVLRSGVTNPGSAGAAITEEATGVPANVAVALALTIGVRDSAGSNVAISAVNWDGTTAFQNFRSGVAGRGGFALASPVLCGGLNGRQFKWAGSVTGVATTYYVYVNGYWMVG